MQYIVGIGKDHRDAVAGDRQQKIFLSTPAEHTLGQVDETVLPYPEEIGRLRTGPSPSVGLPSCPSPLREVVPRRVVPIKSLSVRLASKTRAGF